MTHYYINNNMFDNMRYNVSFQVGGAVLSYTIVLFTLPSGDGSGGVNANATAI